MTYICIALIGLCAVMVVGLTVWLATFLNLGKLLLLLGALGGSILAVSLWNLLVVGIVRQSPGGNLSMLFTDSAYAWNVTRAVFIPALFGSLIAGVALYAGARLFRHREKRLAGIALLGASALSLFLLFITSGALLIMVDGG